jgi:hypothetical protein
MSNIKYVWDKNKLQSSGGLIMFFLKINALVFFILTISSSQDFDSLFSLEFDMDTQHLYTPFLQTLIYTPTPQNSIVSADWLDSINTVKLMSGKVFFSESDTFIPSLEDSIIETRCIYKPYVVRHKNGRVFCFFQTDSIWQLKNISPKGSPSKQQLLTFIGRQAAEDIQAELEKAKALVMIHDYYQITVQDSLFTSKDILHLPKNWEYRVFRDGKLILLKKGEQYFPLSASFFSEKLVWSCTYHGFNMEFNHFNEFFIERIEQTAITLP